jgi:hypothetical protein
MGRRVDVHDESERRPESFRSRDTQLLLADVVGKMS